MEDDVQQTVFGIIAREASLDVAKITPQSTLKDLEIPSLEAIQIIFEIEDHYRIQLPDHDPDFDSGSVGAMVEAVRRVLTDRASGPPVATPHAT